MASKAIITDVRRRRRVQAEALAAARVALYRARAAFGVPAPVGLDAAAAVREAVRLLADARGTR